MAAFILAMFILPASIILIAIVLAYITRDKED